MLKWIIVNVHISNIDDAGIDAKEFNLRIEFIDEAWRTRRWTCLMFYYEDHIKRYGIKIPDKSMKVDVINKNILFKTLSNNYIFRIEWYKIPKLSTNHIIDKISIPYYAEHINNIIAWLFAFILLLSWLSLFWIL